MQKKITNEKIKNTCFQLFFLASGFAFLLTTSSVFYLHSPYFTTNKFSFIYLVYALLTYACLKDTFNNVAALLNEYFNVSLSRTEKILESFQKLKTWSFMIIPIFFTIWIYSIYFYLCYKHSESQDFVFLSFSFIDIKITFTVFFLYLQIISVALLIFITALICGRA